MEYLLTRTSFVSGGFGILVESMTSTFCMTSKLAFPYQTSMKWKIFKNLDIDFYVKWLGFVILDLESFTRNFYSGIIAIIVLNGCIITFISRMSVGPTFPFWSSGIISWNQSFLVSVKFSYNFITWFGIFIIRFFFPIGCKSFLRFVQYYFICWNNWLEGNFSRASFSTSGFLLTGSS